jgi:hypothetical protein
MKIEALKCYHCDHEFKVKFMVRPKSVGCPKCSGLVNVHEDIGFLIRKGMMDEVVAFGDAATPLLIRALNGTHASGPGQVWAAGALGGIGTQMAADQLVKMYDGTELSEWRRYGMYQHRERTSLGIALRSALGKCGDNAQPAIRERLENDDPLCSEFVDDVVAMIDSTCWETLLRRAEKQTVAVEGGEWGTGCWQFYKTMRLLCGPQLAETRAIPTELAREFSNRIVCLFESTRWSSLGPGPADKEPGETLRMLQLVCPDEGKAECVRRVVERFAGWAEGTSKGLADKTAIGVSLAVHDYLLCVLPAVVTDDCTRDALCALPDIELREQYREAPSDLDLNDSERDGLYRTSGKISFEGVRELARKGGGRLVIQLLDRTSRFVATGDIWQTVFTNVPSTPTSTNFVDAGASNGPVFYRIRAVRLTLLSTQHHISIPYPTA